VRWSTLGSALPRVRAARCGFPFSGRFPYNGDGATGMGPHPRHRSRCSSRKCRTPSTSSTDRTSICSVRAEPELYGHATIADVETLCRCYRAALRLAVEFHPINHEGELIDWVQEARAKKARRAWFINRPDSRRRRWQFSTRFLTMEAPVIEDPHYPISTARSVSAALLRVRVAARGGLRLSASRGYALAINRLGRMIAQRGDCDGRSQEARDAKTSSDRSRSDPQLAKLLDETA